MSAITVRRTVSQDRRFSFKNPKHFMTHPLFVSGYSLADIPFDVLALLLAHVVLQGCHLALRIIAVRYGINIENV